MRRLNSRSGVAWALLLVVGLVGCTPTPMPSPTATSTLPPTPTPTVTSTLTPTPTPSPPPQKPVLSLPGKVTLEAGKKIAIRASALGAERYEWRLARESDGLISPTEGDATLYTAPTGRSGLAILTVVAYNAHGASPPATLEINVVPKATIRLDALANMLSLMSRSGDPSAFIKPERSPDDCHTGSDCLRFTYEPGGEWGSVHWWPFCVASAASPTLHIAPGPECSINVLQVGNLSEVNRLTFWARGDQGGEIVEFRVGSVNVSPGPFRSSGRVTLTTDWQGCEIDLAGMDLVDAIDLFVWFATDRDNPGGAVFYLDDVQSEGAKEPSSLHLSAGQNLVDLLTRLYWGRLLPHTLRPHDDSNPMAV